LATAPRADDGVVGFSDGQEINPMGTDPTRRSTDGDPVRDWSEGVNGTHPFDLAGH
jgi:hypothetical protein